MAVRVGFEPTLGFPLNTLSKRAPSTTRPPHLARRRRASRRKARHIDCGASRASGAWPPGPAGPGRTARPAGGRRARPPARREPASQAVELRGGVRPVVAQGGLDRRPAGGRRRAGRARGLARAGPAIALVDQAQAAAGAGDHHASRWRRRRRRPRPGRPSARGARRTSGAPTSSGWRGLAGQAAGSSART